MQGRDFAMLLSFQDNRISPKQIYAQDACQFIYPTSRRPFCISIYFCDTFICHIVQVVILKRQVLLYRIALVLFVLQQLHTLIYMRYHYDAAELAFHDAVNEDIFL